MAQRLTKRLLLIGWDGADWDQIRPLVSQGKMPNLARLLEGGVSGNLATIQPVLSPMLWTSIATGKRADKHGILGFVEPMPDRSGVRPVTSTSRTCKAIWNLLTQAGMTSQVVSWFASHPAEPVSGTVVTDRYVAQCCDLNGPPKFSPGTFHPADLEADLAALLTRPNDLDAEALLAFVPKAAEVDQSKDPRVFKVASLLSRAASVHAATMRLLDNDDWDFTAAYYVAIDEFGHTFMPYQPPRLAGIEERDAALFGGVVEACYRFHDMMLGATLAKAGPETTVMLVSDHGFKSGSDRPGPCGYDDPVAWHRSLGVACLYGPGVQAGAELFGASVLDVTPTALTLLGQPVGQDMDGRPWLEVLDNPGGARTIPTWESLDGEDGRHPEPLREDASASAEAIRQLVALGYLEPPSEDAEEAVARALADQKLNLALALADSQRAADALGLWEELVEEHPTDHDLKHQLAACYCLHLRFDEAERTLESLPADRLRQPDALLHRARIAGYQGRGAEAVLPLIDEALRVGCPTAALLNSAGIGLLQFGEWERAETVFLDSVGIEPSNPVASTGLSEIAWGRGDFQAAADRALEALESNHFFPKAHYCLGVALQSLERHSDAATALGVAKQQGCTVGDLETRIRSLRAVERPWSAVLPTEPS